MNPAEPDVIDVAPVCEILCPPNAGSIFEPAMAAAASTSALTMADEVMMPVAPLCKMPVP
jgi:hypothetical protein